MTGSPPYWVRIWQPLAPLDRWFAALRGVTLVAGMVWWAIHLVDHPKDPEAHRQILLLMGAFAGYSALLYVISVRWPGHLRRLYRAAMVLDLAFIFLLVRTTGGMASNFYLAFYLLIALHAFYFGLATGVTVAVSASLLYLFADGWPPAIHMTVHLSDLGLRMGLFLLVGFSMGGLAERERRERQVVEQLNRELRERHQRLREAQEQLIRSDRLATVGELAAGLAHDLRNPLAGISGALHVLTDQLPPDDARRALLAEVQAQISRMNKTLSDLLRHARPPALQSLPLNVNEIVEESLWLLPMGSGKEKEIEIVKQLDPNLPTLLLDPTLLHQALLNILVNARQAMPNGGRLTVNTRLGNGAFGKQEVKVVIGDTGPGIPREDLSRIFQPFFTTKAQGTGLGLAIAARIVEQHNGQIVVESEVGKGTTFRLTFPVPTEGAADNRTGAVTHVGSAS